MIEILTKISVKITIIVVKNREPYYFIIIYRCKEVLLSLFSYQMLASTLTPMSSLVTLRSMLNSGDMYSLKIPFNSRGPAYSRKGQVSECLVMQHTS